MSIRLSKSRFIAGVQCLKRLYLQVHQPELGAEPGAAADADRIVEVLAVLQTLAKGTNIDGSFTASGLELWQKHSVGEKAWITDESESNKRDFRNELEFVDPGNPQVILFCPWHGKVKKGQFRIHFEWPRPRNQKRIRVVYIGPKITKH